MENSWGLISNLRKSQIESGNDITFSDLFIPYYKRLFSLLPHKKILEIGCGTGHMAQALINVLNPTLFIALDESKEMIQLARKVNRDVGIEILEVDYLNFSSVHKFDLIYSHMCLQTIEEIEAVIEKSSKLLTKNGYFIFSIPHPCFYNLYKGIFPEESFEYKRKTKTFFELTITNSSQKSNPIPYIHRPLETYFNIVGAHFQKIQLEEIFPTIDVMAKYEKAFKYPHYIMIKCSNSLNPIQT